MSSKSSLLLIGLIVGCCAGYGASFFYTPPFLEEFFQDENEVMYDELYRQNQNLSDLYRGTLSEISELSENYKALENEHILLSDEFDALTRDYEEMAEVLNETRESYESLLMQYQIITGSAPLTPQILSNDTIRKDFAWIYEGKTWAFSLYIPEHLYLYYSNMTRIPTGDYSVYVTHPHDDEYLTTIIDQFESIAMAEGYDNGQMVNLVVSFIQSLPYATDDVTTGFDEYPRYPIETLVEGGGDCEDTSILASALLDMMGFDVVLINLPDHYAVGVAVEAYGTYWRYEGVDYFYVETTGEGWEIGELPEEHQGAPAVIYPLLPVPVCALQWTASTLNHKVTLVADVQNVGTGDATGIKLFAGFEDGEERIWNPVEGELFDLGVGEEITVMLELDEPRGMHIRLVARVLDPWGYVMDESHSVWYDTD